MGARDHSSNSAVPGLTGFEETSTKNLLVIRENLVKGIQAVADSLDRGTFHQIGPKGEASPAIAGQLTWILFQAVEEELERRK